VLIFDKRTTAHWHRYLKISREKKEREDKEKRERMYTHSKHVFLSTSRIYIDRINSQLTIRVGCGPTLWVA